MIITIWKTNIYLSSFKQSHTSSISLYLHPSMTEDPWSDLLARLECLNKSEITLKSQAKVEDTVDEGDKDELIVQ